MIRSVFGVAVGFGILSVVFGLLEYWSPAAVPAPRRSNRAPMTDLLYWIFTAVTSAAIVVCVAIAFAAVGVLARGFTPGTLKT